MNAPQVPGMACPFCGLRPLEEFLFRKTVPNFVAGSGAYEQVYLRVDSAEQSVEEWQHVAGCRAWLIVDRNPSTGVVRSVALLGATQ
jgi:sarcosine oxidase subunit delta